MEGFDFVHQETVRFRDVDAMGHVNNAVFLTYIEEARIAYLLRFGAEVTQMILARAEIDFRAQARYGDELEVQLSIASIGRSSFTYEYQIVRLPAGDLIASARSVQVWFDYDRERPVPLSDEMKRQLAVPIGG